MTASGKIPLPEDRERTRTKCRVGTSGWHYRHWAGRFYPQDQPRGDYLAHYSSRFETVEINNSFYRLPSEEALKNWAEVTPPAFVFACKASRYITHMKKLKDAEHSLPMFLGRMQVLGDKLGPVLFQLPPRWQANAERLEGFLKALPRDQRFAFEFRDQRWNRPEVLRLLEKYGCALCVFDLGGTCSPTVITAGFTYIRLHGPDAPYRGSYTDACLADWAARIAGWQTGGLDVYCYFDNDEQAFAPRNAHSLISLLLDPRT